MYLLILSPELDHGLGRATLTRPAMAAADSSSASDAPSTGTADDGGADGSPRGPEGGSGRVGDPLDTNAMDDGEATGAPGADPGSTGEMIRYARVENNDPSTFKVDRGDDSLCTRREQRPIEGRLGP